MANSTLANLTASGALTGTELFYSDNGAQDVKVTANQLKTVVVGAGAISVASGKTLTVSNTLTLAGTDGSTLNVGAGGTLGTGAFVNTGTSGGTVPLLNAGNTWSATQALAVTGYSLTGANAQGLLDLSGTLNTSGSPSIIKLNLTNTASGTATKFADFQLGGTSQITLTTGGTTPSVGLNIAGNNFGGWSLINGADAGVTNNFEVLQAYWASNVVNLDSTKVGTGTVRVLRLASGGSAALDIGKSGGATSVTLAPTTAIPAGGTAGLGYLLSTTANFGTFFGSGAPTLSAAKGSLYLRSDGTTTNNRAYINTDGGTTWTALTTAA